MDTGFSKKDAERWAVMQTRDKAAARQFIMAVRTTGIYCRPGCPARMPLAKNVQFHDSIADAREAGFRACKRCKPDEIA